MAKKMRSEGFSKPIRNRGEDIGQPRANVKYDYQPQDQYSDKAQERAIRRHEVRAIYDQMYRENQERDQRAFERLREMKNEFYAGVDPRRRQELSDAGMIREDHNAMANLPRQAQHHEFPQQPFYESPYFADIRRGVDPERDDDGKSMARYLNPRDSYTEK